MDVKQAAKVAKEYVIDLFADEQIEHVGLEEVKFNQHSKFWEITIGFFRPWNRGPLSFGPSPAQRSYKIVSIDDTDGQVTSVKHRVMDAAG